MGREGAEREQSGAAALHSHLELRKFKIYKRKCYENVTWAQDFGSSSCDAQ